MWGGDGGGGGMVMRVGGGGVGVVGVWRDPCNENKLRGDYVGHRVHPFILLGGLISCVLYNVLYIYLKISFKWVITVFLVLSK